MEITTSALAQVDPFFWLIGNIRARKETIKREYNFAASKQMRDRVMSTRPEFARAARSALAVLNEMESLLDSTSIIKHTHTQHAEPLASLTGTVARTCGVLKQVRKEYADLGTSSEQIKKIFNLPSRGPADIPVWMRTIMDKMKVNSGQARMSEHKFRMIEEVTLRASQGWYIVFNTLTVAPEDYNKVFDKGSIAWQRYVVGYTGRSLPAV